MTPERLQEITLAAQAEAPYTVHSESVDTWTTYSVDGPGIPHRYCPTPQIAEHMAEVANTAYAAALVKSAVRAEVLLEVLHDLRHGSFDSEQAVNDRIDAALHGFNLSEP